MDLETENRLAALLMDEARRLRAQADKEGVHVYLRKPNVRARPNSRFLTATVLGVQQANKAVEVDELWRAREKELELDNKLVHKYEDRDKYREVHSDPHVNVSSSRHDKAKSSSSYSYAKVAYTSRHDKAKYSSSSSSKYTHEDFPHDDGGFMDEDIEKFLQSRIKRGRGAIGSRMDDPGPYPDAPSDADKDTLRTEEEWEHRVLGPEKPPSSRSQKSADDIISSSTKKEKPSSSKKRHRHVKERKEKSDKKRRKEKLRHRHKSP